MDSLVLFGAGELAAMYVDMFSYLQIDVTCFADNSEAKWGKSFLGKTIVCPEALIHMDCSIFITCTFVEEITDRLISMGLGSRIISLDTVCSMSRKVRTAPYNNESGNVGWKILFDIYGSTQWAGTENWALNLASCLIQKKMEVYLLGRKELPLISESYEVILYRIVNEDVILQLVRIIEENLPCILINNFGRFGFLSAIIAKLRNPGQVKIVSVIHCDDKKCFDKHMRYYPFIDSVFCVSTLIKQKVEIGYPYVKEIYSVIQAIQYEKDWERIDEENGFIRIGYAARLEKKPKRADLLPRLIEYLEKRHVDYIFQIAGVGECLDLLRDYVATNHLEQRVKILGMISRTDMKDFWRQQDVFINISEYEGCSLSMLEAMSWECVPVVTDVSGVRDVIEDGKNGFICPVGDLERIAECVNKLSLEPNLRKALGRLSRKSIEDNCCYDKYVMYWIKYLHELEMHSINDL